VKRKSLARLQSDLLARLRPEIDLATLANVITKFLHKHVGESPRHVNLAHNLARYLAGKYSVCSKWGELNRLIEYYADDLSDLLEELSSEDFRAFLKTADRILPLKQKKGRVRAQTETEAAQRRKKSKSRYERHRRQYRVGLIVKQFGRSPSVGLLDPLSNVPTESPCLDILFSGGAVQMAGHWDSLENLFGVDRHRFPKSLPHKRIGRTKVYYLDAFMECLIHLLANREGDEQWLAEPTLRDLVLRRIIQRAHRLSPGIGDMLAEKLRPYLR
jgi:hypothetical protein